MGEKRCSKCKKVKSIDNFYRRKERVNQYLSRCKTCIYEGHKEWRAKNPEKMAAATIRWRKKNPKVQQTQWLRRDYGITSDDFDKLHTLQKGVCAICGKTETDAHSITKKPKRLAVDHCPKTGVIRGLLCAKCNRGLGMFLHDKTLLDNGIAYLTRAEKGIGLVIPKIRGRRRVN